MQTSLLRLRANRQVAVRLVARHAGHEQDAPASALRFHLPGGKLGVEKTALQIDRHELLEAFRRVSKKSP